jgi:hypothetical protein
LAGDEVLCHDSDPVVTVSVETQVSGIIISFKEIQITISKSMKYYGIFYQ